MDEGIKDTMTPTEPDPRYPIGEFSPPQEITRDQIHEWIDDIAGSPADLRRTVAPLTDAQLDTPYRPDGWTVRQVVHHLPDSHMNSFIRFKWALTEERPLSQGLRREGLGRVGRRPRAGRPVARPAGDPASPLGGPAARPHLGAVAARSSCTRTPAPSSWPRASVTTPGTAVIIWRTFQRLLAREGWD